MGVGTSTAATVVAMQYWAIACWVAMALYWMVAARSALRGGDAPKARRNIAVRAAIIVAVLVAFRLSGAMPTIRLWQGDSTIGLAAAMGGAALVTVGFVLAVWARRTIGRNWGMPGERKDATDLVTSGPYARVRHPIYSAMLLMLVGSALAINPKLWLALALVLLCFLFIARNEERQMMRRFPAAYPSYRARTKMVVPFLL